MQNRGYPTFAQRLSALLLLSLCAMASLCLAQDDAVRGKIVALEKAWNQAYKAADTRALSDLLDDSIVLINDDGSTQPSVNSWTVSKRPALKNSKSHRNRSPFMCSGIPQWPPACFAPPGWKAVSTTPGESALSIHGS